MRPVHERVRDHIRRHRATYAEVADACGWTEQRLSRMLRGVTRMSVDDAEKIAKAIDVSAGELFHDLSRRWAA